MNVQASPSECLSAQTFPSKLILSVDDEPKILYLRQAILEHQGYRVLNASDGELALELFDAHPIIYLVLLDYVMPDMDGGAVAREMKARRPSVPIFMVSTHDALVSRIALPCVDLVIPKGIGPCYLLEKINQLFAPVAASPRSA